MNATITLDGPVPYGRTMFELQATITTDDGDTKCLKWSLHHKMEEAENYRDCFNSHQSTK